MEAINSRSWVLSLAFSIPICTLSAVTPVELVWTSVSFVFQSPTVCNFPEPRVHLSEVGMGCRDKVWGIPGHSLWDLLPGNAVIPLQWDKNVSELHRSVQTPAGSICNTVRKKGQALILGWRCCPYSCAADSHWSRTFKTQMFCAKTVCWPWRKKRNLHRAQD